MKTIYFVIVIAVAVVSVLAFSYLHSRYEVKILRKDQCNLSEQSIELHHSTPAIFAMIRSNVITDSLEINLDTIDGNPGGYFAVHTRTPDGEREVFVDCAFSIPTVRLANGRIIEVWTGENWVKVLHQ